jgi:two-component system cell cycle response regulator DivK
VTKILVVEDDSMNRDMVMRRLKLDGYQVIGAADGAQAVSLARSEQPDLILMDMGLPVMNGWQATHRIKHAPETEGIPIIALTAYALTEDRAKCLAVGCDDYETKPIDFSRLFAKIGVLLRRRQETRAGREDSGAAPEATNEASS